MTVKRSFQWYRNQAACQLTVTGLTPDDYTLWDFADQTADVALSLPFHMHRIFLDVLIAATNNGERCTAFGHLHLGLVRVPAVMTDQLSVASQKYVDMYWVYRASWPIGVLEADGPRGAPERFLSSSDCRLDWDLRSGKGTKLDRDVSLRLIASWEPALSPLGDSNQAFLALDVSSLFLLSTI